MIVTSRTRRTTCAAAGARACYTNRSLTKSLRYLSLIASPNDTSSSSPDNFPRLLCFRSHAVDLERRGPARRGLRWQGPAADRLLGLARLDGLRDRHSEGLVQGGWRRRQVRLV